MSDHKIARVGLLSAAVLGLAMMVWPGLVGGQQAAAEKEAEGKASVADKESSETIQTTSSLNEVYKKANQAYSNQNYPTAYRLYRQLIRRKEELGWWQAWTVEDNFEATKQALQRQHTESQKKKAARAALERIEKSVASEKLDAAQKEVNKLKKQQLAQYLSDNGRQKLKAAKKKLPSAQKAEKQKEKAEKETARKKDEAEKTEKEKAADTEKAEKKKAEEGEKKAAREEEKTAEKQQEAKARAEARKQLKQVQAAMKDEKYEKAAQLIAGMQKADQVGKLKEARRKQLSGWRKQIYAETEESDILTTADRREIARSRFAAGMQAYEEGRYTRAKKLLDEAAAMDVSLGWWDDWTLSDTRAELKTRRANIQERLKTAKNLYEKNKLPEAHEEFSELQAKLKGGKAYPEISKVVDDHVARISEKRKGAKEKQQQAAAGLARVNKSLSRRDLDAAEKRLKKLEEEGLMQHLSAEEQKDLKAAKEKLKTLQQVEERWKGLGTAMEEENYEEGARLIAQMEEADQLGRLDKERRERLNAWRKEIYENNESPGVLTAEQRRVIARARYDAGMQAYEEGRYTRAKNLLDEAAAMDVSLGWWDDGTLADTRAELKTQLKDIRKKLKAAKGLYEEKKLTEAHEKFVQLRKELKDGEKAFPKISKTVEDYINRIERTQRAMKIKQARRYQEKIKDLSEARKHKLAQLRSRRQKRQKILENVEKSQPLLEQEKYDRAEKLLRSARKNLNSLQWGEDAELKRAGRTIQERLKRIKEVSQKRQAREKIADALQTAREKVGSEPVKAMANLQKAKDISKRSGVALTDPQNEKVKSIKESLQAELGVTYKLAREQVEELKRQATKYYKTGELRKARACLNLARERGDDYLTANEKSQLSQALPNLSDRMQEQRKVLDRIEDLQQEGQTNLSAGQVSTAAEKCEKALRQAEEANIPLDLRVSILKLYRDVLKKGTNKAALQISDKDQKSIQEGAAEVEAMLPYYRARYYLEHGSPDAARKYLQEVSDAENEVGRQKASWAENKLKGLEATIEELHDEELAERSTELQRVYEVEKNLSNLADTTPKKVKQFDRRLANARLRLRIKKLQQYLSRNAYPQAREVLRDTIPEDADAEVKNSYQERAKEVQAWERGRKLIDRSLQNVKEWRPEVAQEYFQQLMSVPAKGPVASIKRHLTASYENLQVALGQTREKQQQWENKLARVGKRLKKARQRQEMYDLYWTGRKAYILEEWEKAADTLESLEGKEASKGSEVDGLHPFERSQVNDMRSRAVAEDEAQDLYRKAVRAKKVGNSYELSQTLEKLDQDYKDTWTYRKHY